MTYKELVYDAQYFKHHSAHWQGISEDLNGHRTDAQGAKCNQTSLYASLVPGFTEVHDKVADTIIDSLIGRGVGATSKLSEMLELACRNYIAGEAQNVAEANKILEEAGF